jgi:hypothetical protein
MNKKMILLGAAALIGCFVFTSFDKMTLAQQKEMIAQAVTSQLDALRVEKETACTESVNAEATNRFNAWVEAEAAKPAVAGVKKKVFAKKNTGGPKVDPLPQTTPPATDPQKTRGGSVKEGDIQAEKTRSGGAKEGDVQQQKTRGGAVKKEGGN